MIDTHCHLNFKYYKDNVDEVIDRAKEAGIGRFIVPGTDITTSKKAVELAQKYEEVYAAVGIHPHHIYQYQSQKSEVPTSPAKDGVRGASKSQDYKSKVESDLEEIESLLTEKKVVAVGEVGIDKYFYRDTKYSKYVVNPEFVELQKMAFIMQIKLAIKYKKSLIIHNREAVGETLEIIGDSSILTPLAGQMVLHCCEANEDLLSFALAHQIYIGVDGDVTYRKSKQEFIKKVPVELLLLETDSPFLLPEPLRTEKKYPNEPKNLTYIAQKVAQLKEISLERLIETTTKNSESWIWGRPQTAA